MPQNIILNVGADSATHTFPGSAAAVRASIVRICRSLGISTDGTPAEVGQRLLDHIVDDMLRRAKAASIREIQQAQSAANQQQAIADNPI